MSNKKDIKDYLHLYLGCECWDEYDNDIKQLYAVGLDNVVLHKNTHHTREFIEIKPILRPLSDMSEDECDEFGIDSVDGEYIHDCFQADAIYGTWNAKIEILAFAERLNEMRKRGFDCDGLIELGLAIDKTATKPPN